MEVIVQEDVKIGEGLWLSRDRALRIVGPDPC